MFLSYTVLCITQCCLNLDLFEELNDWVERGLARWPDYTNLEYGRGMSYLKQKNYTRALESFNACLALGEPPARYSSRAGVGSWGALIGLGACHESLNQYDWALAAWFAALKLNPRAYLAAENVVSLLSSLGRDAQRIRLELEPYVDLTEPGIKRIFEELLGGE